MHKYNGISENTPDAIKNGVATANSKPSTKAAKNGSSKETSIHLKTILEIQKQLKETKAQTVIFSKPILTYSDKPVIYPRTITVVQGQSGSFKSRLVELICSVLLWERGAAASVFEATSGKPISICYVDTERNLTEQFPYALQRIQTNAGFPIAAHPERLDFISLMPVPRQDRFSALREYLEYVRTKYQTHIVVVLDVLTDCCMDFNRTDSSMELIDFLNLTINQYDVSFVCIIHENPGTAKARGHLGTELNNKASTVMQVGYETDASGQDTDLVKVKFLKCRNTKRHDPFYLKYSDEAKGLVLASEDDVSKVSEGKKAKAAPSDVADKVEKYLMDEPMSGKDLIELLMKDFEAGKRTIEERLKEIQEKDTDFNKDGKPCKLVKATMGRAVMYSLQPIG